MSQTISRVRTLVVGSLLLVFVPIAGPANLASAAAPPADTFHGLVPARLLDTRIGGDTIDELFEQSGPVAPSSTTNVTIRGRGGVPFSGVGAVALNVTGVGATANTFVTVWPTGLTKPDASNLNLQAGVPAIPNMVIVPLGDIGQISIFNNNGNPNLLVDVLGWFPTGDSFTGLVPARLMDTRIGGDTIDELFEQTGPVGPTSTTELTVLNRGGVPSDGVGAVALNVTGANATANSFVTVWPKGNAKPDASNLNLRGGVPAIPNMVIVPVGTDGSILLFNNNGNTNLIVDVLGWFPTGDSFDGLVPARLMDTRIGGDTIDELFEQTGPVGPTSTTELTVIGRGGVPAENVGAVALNVTGANATANSFVTVWPTGTDRPDASNLNLRGGIPAIPNMVIVPIGLDGKISLFNNNGNTNLIVDVLGWFPTTFAPSSMERVSLADDDDEGINPSNSEEPSISADGRFVAFTSDATNLVVGDTNGLKDVFVRDRLLGTTQRVSVAGTNTQATGGVSTDPTISADGRYIAFESTATNLVGSDLNGFTDVFLRDMVALTTTRISTGPSNLESNGHSLNASISATGRYIAFDSQANNLLGVGNDANAVKDVFVFDLVGVTVSRVSVATGGIPATSGQSLTPSISDDGRYVAFSSFSEEMIDPLDDNNGNWDVFVHDRTLVTTERVSVTSAGAEVGFGGFLPAISGDGRYVAWESSDAGLVAGDTNADYDIFVRDRTMDTTTRVSVNSFGVETLSGEESGAAAISPDGRYVTYGSEGSNLVPSDSNSTYDVFVFDRFTNVTTRVSLDTGGGDPNNGSETPDISNNGRFIAFTSFASDLVVLDGTGGSDIFVFDQGTI